MRFRPSSDSARPALPRRVGVALAGLALAVFGTLALAAPASAHDALVSTDPTAGSTVDALPSELVLRYSGDLIADAGSTEVDVTDASGASLADGSAEVAGATVRQKLAASGTVTGTVTVTWKVVSGDGHAISGRYVFGVGEAPTTPAPIDPDDTAASAGAGTVLAIVAGIAAVLIIAIVVYVITRSRRSGASRDGSDDDLGDELGDGLSDELGDEPRDR